MSWLVLTGSLGAVFAVAGLVWLLGLGKSPGIADAKHAMQLAREAQSGFRPAGAVIDAKGRAALVRGNNGEIILVRPHGAQMAARIFKSAPAIEREGGRLKIATGERMFGDVMLELDEKDAKHWAKRLEGAPYA